MSQTVCLTDDDVAAFVSRALDDTRRAEVEAHLDMCPACFELVGEFGRVFESVSAIASTRRRGPEAAASVGPGLRDLSVLLQATLQGQQIGPYVVETLVGWGGAAVVYAGRDERLDRPVALKIIAAEGVAPEPLKEEARIVAQLGHPNVVEVYDVRDEAGRVIIVMELVTGGTLRTWQRSASRSEILAMYLAAGEGVAAAHGAGLVHRDFKPDNVLVGGDGRPRVSDFGLAATVAQPTSVGGSSPSGSVVGTPRYMAPEQRRGDRVDPRADQYAFCVALLEALTGWRDGDMGDALRQLPATQASALRRGLESDPERRWPSMRALLDALATSGRARRRWPIALLGASALGMALFMAWPSDEDDACEAVAEPAAAAWSPQRREALRGHFAATAPTLGPPTWERVDRALDAWFVDWSARRVDLCRQARESNDADSTRRQRPCLEHALREAEGWLDALDEADAKGIRRAVLGTEALPALADCTNPTQDAAVMPDAVVQARAARRVGDYARAHSLASARLALGDVDDERVLSALRYEAAAAVAEGGLDGDAVPLYTEAYWNAAAVDDAERMVQAAGSLAHHLATRAAKPDDAQQWVEHARAAAARAQDNGKLQAHLAGVEASVATTRGDHAVAAKLLERAIELRLSLGGERARVAALRGNLAVALNRAGDLQQAEAVGRKALADLEEVLGPDHPDTANVANTLGSIFAEMLRYDDALAFHRRALKVREAQFGPDHPLTATVVSNIARLYDKTGRHDEAIEFYRRAIATMRRRESVDPSKLAIMLSNLAGVYVAAKRWEQAQPLVDEAFTLLSDALGPEHPVVATIGANAASLHSRLGDHAWADAQCPRSLATLEAKFGPDHRRLVGPLTNCGEHDLRAGESARARPRLRHARRIVDANREGFDPGTRSTVAFALARALDSDPAKRDEARTLAREALRDLEGVAGVRADDLAELKTWLHDREKN